ncbi:MAG TPA: DMSO reductase [Gammaproteobacteria bacterium]|nr:DMSO reductase [Gammaproteobacteria bacterium]
MHPAFSVIFLTTLIGAGQGLFLALYTAQVYSQFRFLPQQHIELFYAWGSGLSVLLLLLGLVASFFHLGHPERAWRAASQWRTSWLSREVIILPVAMLLIAAYGAAHYLGLTRPLYVMPGGSVIDLTAILGLLATIAVFLLYICTGMIYASLKFLQEWHSPLTVINYILLGAASGFVLATALATGMNNGLTGFYAGWALLLTIVAAVFRLAALMRNRRLRPKSSPRSAIGVRHAAIAQTTQGAMGGSFNTREYFHGKSRAFFKSIRYVFITLAFAIPALLIAIVFVHPALNLAVAAFLIQYLGLVAERWYFFADANHPQNIYYQSIA